MADNDVNVTLKATTTDFQNNMKTAATAAESSLGKVKMSTADLTKAMAGTGPAAEQLRAAMASTATAATAAAAGISSAAAAQARAAGGAAQVQAGLAGITNGLKLSRNGFLELQASGINAFQALASGMGPLRVLEMEGAQVFGALIQGGILTKSTLLSLSPVFYAAAAAVAVLGGAFISAAFHAEEMRKAIVSANDAAILLGHVGFNPENTEQYIKGLQATKGVTQEMAGQIAHSIELIPYVTDKAKNSIGDLALAFSQAKGIKLEDSVNALLKAYSGTAQNMYDFAKANVDLTDKQRDDLIVFAGTNSVLDAQGVLVDALTAKLQPLIEKNEQLQRVQSNVTPGGRFRGGQIAAVDKVQPTVAIPQRPLEDVQVSDTEALALRTKFAIAAKNVEIAREQDRIAKSSGDAKTNAEDTLKILTRERDELQKQFDIQRYGPKEGSSSAKRDAITEIDAEIAATREGTQERVNALEHYAAEAKRLYGENSSQYHEAQARIAAAERQFQQQSYQTKIAQMNDEMALLRAGSAEKIAILKQETALAAKQFGEQSKEYADALRRETLELRTQQAENVRIMTEAVDTQKEIDLLKLEDKKAGYDAEAQIGRLSGSEKLRDLLALEQSEYDIEKKAIDDKIALMATDPTSDPNATRRLHAQQEVLEQQHQNRINQINRQGVADARARWQQMVAPIDNAFKQITNGILQGTQTWKQVVGNAVDSIVAATAQGAEQMLSDYVTSILAGEAAQNTSASSQIGTNAATAASGAYSSAASIPYVGWILGPAAAAAAFVAVMAYKSSIGSFAVGTDNVPHDMTAQIHKGEIIVPQTMASAIRGGDMTLGGPGQAGVTNASSSTNFHYAPTIMAPPDPDIGDMLTRHGSKMLKFIEMSMRDGKLKMPRA